MFTKVFVSTPDLVPTSGAGVEGEELGCLNGTVGNLTTSGKEKKGLLLGQTSSSGWLQVTLPVGS